MIVLLFGPPGCGKGTQAVFLAKGLQVPAISTGEMLRAECNSSTPLANAVRSTLARGELIGDDIVNAMVAQRIARPDCADGCLLDGYPRTVAQARYFSKLLGQRRLPAPLLIHLHVAQEELVRRLTARRQCPSCRRIYNLLSRPPASPGICDTDGTALVTREDDRESVIRDRLHAYEAQTGPVLDFYGKANVLRVDGSQPPADVSARIGHLLASRQSAPETRSLNAAS